MGKGSVLSNDEFQTLFFAYKQGNQEALAKLVEANQGLIGYVADHFFTGLSTGQYADGMQSKVIWEDMMQSGNVGLLCALQRFDPERGAQFSTYAMPHIRKYIRLFINSCLLIKTARFQYRKTFSSDSTKKEQRVEPESLQRAIKNKNQLEQRASVIQKILGLFTERERQIVSLRFGFDDKDELSYKQIGEMLGISRQQTVINIYQKCLAEIKIIYSRYEETGKILREMPVK